MMRSASSLLLIWLVVVRCHPVQSFFHLFIFFFVPSSCFSVLCVFFCFLCVLVLCCTCAHGGCGPIPYPSACRGDADMSWCTFFSVGLWYHQWQRTSHASVAAMCVRPFCWSAARGLPVSFVTPVFPLFLCFFLYFYCFFLLIIFLVFIFFFWGGVFSFSSA